MPDDRSDPLIEELRAIVGASHAVSDRAVLAGRLQDWTGRWNGFCRVAVSPASGPEVGATLAACSRNGVHVVVQGGNTGLVGGAVPQEGDVLLCTDRLRDLEPPDEVAHTVVVGAGVPLAQLQRHLEPYGLELPVDLAARESATLGGMAATNAGGLRVLHDGDMRRQILSVDAYAMDGAQLAVLHPLVKDNTGYPISSLLVGSEGTLAAVTRLLLRVVPRVPAGAVVVLGLADLEQIMAVVAAVRRRVRDLRAVETVSAKVRDLIADARGSAPPVRAPWLLLLEVGAAARAFEDLTECVESALDALNIRDAPVAAAQDAAGMRALWSWRDGATDAIAQSAAQRERIVVKLDVTIPSARLAAFVRQLERLVVAPDELYLFGHVGDGNLHVNLQRPADRDSGSGPTEDAILRAVAEQGGSISAEHGIGRAKAPWLALARTPDERAAMRAIKDTLDPRGLLGRAIWQESGRGNR